MKNNINRSEIDGEEYEYSYIKVLSCRDDNFREKDFIITGINIHTEEHIEFEDRKYDRIIPVMEYCSLIKENTFYFDYGYRIKNKILVAKNIKDNKQKYVIDFLDDESEICDNNYNDSEYPFGIGGY
jgi:hypothetical protein